METTIIVKNQDNYLKIYLIHLVLGCGLFLFPFLAKIYSPLVFLLGIKIIFRTKNSNHEALFMSAYVVGLEVLLRMTNGMYINEYGKYSVIVFMLLGMYFKGISNKSYWYLFFLFLLIPSVFMAPFVLNLDTDIRKAIAFNISGPVCLGITAMYCYKADISLDDLKRVVRYIGYPLLSVLVYVILYNPSVKEVVTSTQSNFETSGGFGPNQMSTVLGLGIFVFFVQFLLDSKTKMETILNAFLTALFAYRCLVTFSRGGMICGLAMIAFLAFIVFFKTNKKGKLKIGVIGVLLFLSGSLIWGYSLSQTNGLIEKRYANQDARGRLKQSRLSGREDIAKAEIKMFLDNPIFGVGVGKNKEYREELTGIEAASHNEITRMLAEHGAFGVLALLILFFIPLSTFLFNRQHIFLLSFFIFWLLTINHAAMRIAAPAFIYALSLLKVNFSTKNHD
ncbi:O-antigen ligase family protein [Flavobacterium sp.]|uniref:O-antigen ligase family protein n=1 Tax=Flavobacterium sp. TaxID=239 RepID=UPI003D0A2157